jgi:dihydroflavonol-4-reductase
MKRVLVTGATGLLGSNIVSYLNKLNLQVRVLIRKESNMKSLEGLKFEVVKGEISNIFDVEKVMEGCDFVIHSAAKTANDSAPVDMYYDVNVKATKNLIEVSKRNNVKRFVFISTANCFSNGSITNPGNEKSVFMPWLKKSGYAFSKYIAQQEVLKEVKENGFPAIVVSPTFMIGARDVKPSSGKLLLHGFNNKIVFYPPGGKSFVDVEIAAETTCNALFKGKIGEIYLLAGKNMTYKDFFRLVSSVSGNKKLLIPIPKVLLLGVGKVTDMMNMLFKTYKPLDTINAKLLTLDNYFSNKKAAAELEMKNTELTTSIAKAMGWFEKNDYLS